MAIDLDMKDKANITPDIAANVPDHYSFASCSLEYSKEENKIIFR